MNSVTIAHSSNDRKVGLPGLLLGDKHWLLAGIFLLLVVILIAVCMAIDFGSVDAP